MISKHPQLVLVVQDDLCKALLQNSQTSDTALLTLVLRIVFDLLQAVKEHLRVQLEVFFTSIHLRIASSTSSPFSHRQLVLQSLVLGFAPHQALCSSSGRRTGRSRL